MKVVKFIAVFLCGAIVMAAMSCVRSSCIMPQDSGESTASMTDILSSYDPPEVSPTDSPATTTEAAVSVSDAATETTATASTQPPTGAAATTASAAPATTRTSTAARTTTTTTASKTVTTARTTAATTKPTAASTTTKNPPSSTTPTTTTTRPSATAKPTTPTAAPTSSKPTTTTTTVAPTTAKPTTTTAAPGFDIGKYSSYAKSYGQSIGLTYDNGVSSFDTPLILSAATTQPEKRIRDRLDGYASSGYTRFKVWTEQRASDGKWKLYIAYG